MKRFLNILLQVVLWAAVAAYFVFGVRECRHGRKGEKLQSVEIKITDTLPLVTPARVRGWLDSAGVKLEGEPLENINTRQIVGTILAQPLVSGARAWVEHSGHLHVRVGQRRPLARLVVGDVDAYVSDDLWVLPLVAGEPQDVAVVSGDFALPFEGGYYGPLDAGSDEKNLLFLRKILNFVELVEEDSFWSDEVLQIDVRRSATPWSEPEVELSVRSARFRVLLGTLDDIRAKLDKLELFYKNVLPHEGWEAFATLDARNRGQIVTRRARGAARVRVDTMENKN